MIKITKNPHTQKRYSDVVKGEMSSMARFEREDGEIVAVTLLGETHCFHLEIDYETLDTLHRFATAAKEAAGEGK